MRWHSSTEAIYLNELHHCCVYYIWYIDDADKSSSLSVRAFQIQSVKKYQRNQIARETELMSYSIACAMIKFTLSPPKTVHKSDLYLTGDNAMSHVR